MTVTAPAPDLDAAALCEQFARDGYVTVPGALSKGDCQELLTRAAALVEAFDPQSLGAALPLFSTTEQTRLTDDYFLGSGDEIRFFFEPRCVTADGRLTRPKHLCLNKIGHALHELDPVFARHSHSPVLARVVRALGVREPLLLQSMYLFKVPEVGGEVVSHQDATFLYTEPSTCIGLWLALEDATLDNGCLWVQPGGHHGPLRKRFVRTGAGESAPRTTFVALDQTPFAEDQMIPLEVAAGTLVVLHGRLPHRSGENRSARSRHAYSVHVIEAAAHYPNDNWLQRPGGRAGVPL